MVPNAQGMVPGGRRSSRFVGFLEETGRVSRKSSVILVSFWFVAFAKEPSGYMLENKIASTRRRLKGSADSAFKNNPMPNSIS